MSIIINNSYYTLSKHVVPVIINTFIKIIWYSWLSYKLIAYTYYKSVRLFGKKFFEYGTMKTKTDIDVYIIKAECTSLALNNKLSTN